MIPFKLLCHWYAGADPLPPVAADASVVYTLPEQIVSTLAFIVFCKGGVIVIDTSAVDGAQAPFEMAHRNV